MQAWIRLLPESLNHMRRQEVKIWYWSFWVKFDIQNRMHRKAVLWWRLELQILVQSESECCIQDVFKKEKDLFTWSQFTCEYCGPPWQWLMRIEFNRKFANTFEMC
jgi:hypothetical protein